jgi:hypothetical protein
MYAQFFHAVTQKRLTTYLLWMLIFLSHSAVIGQSHSDDPGKATFVRAYISKTSCYLGEPIVLTYKLYSCVQASTDILSLPLLNGFSTTIIDDIASVNPAREQVEGRIFEVYELKKILLTPVISGRLTIGPMEAEHTILSKPRIVPDQSNSGSVSDLVAQLSDTDDSPAKPTIVKSYSNPLEIEVRDLPDFNSASIQPSSVGIFSINGNILSKKISAGSPFEVRFILKGKGNLSTTDSPAIEWPAGVTVIDVQETENRPAATAGFRVSRSLVYTVSSAVAGTLVIPGARFVFFDPALNKYRTAESKVLELQVQAGKQVKKSAVGPEIVPKKMAAVRQKNFRLPALVVSLVGIIILLITFFRRKKRVVEWRDQQGETTLRFDSMFEANDFRMFYHELYDMLWRTLAEKLNVRPTDQNKENILALLRKTGWKEDEIDELEKILDRCAWNLYVPDPENTISCGEMYAKARCVLQRLERA